MPKLGPPVNVLDLYRNIHQKKMKRLSGYDAVLQKCYGRVRQANALDQMRIMFEVPDFMLGVPIYNIQHCMAYMIHQLRTHGFVVTYYFPRILYISWDPQDLPEAQKKKAKHIMTPVYEAPPEAVEACDVPLPPMYHRGGGGGGGIGSGSGSGGGVRMSPGPTPALGPRMRTAPSQLPPSGSRQKTSSIPEYMTTYKPSGKFVLDLT